VQIHTTDKLIPSNTRSLLSPPSDWRQGAKLGVPFRASDTLLLTSGSGTDPDANFGVLDTIVLDTIRTCWC